MSAATSTSPGISLLLDDRYRVEEPIARGGMATVHRGHDERLDRVVALKIMHPHLAMDEDFRRRFGREARAAARLAHRNVVGVFDQGADDDRIYLAMELVEGETLRARIVEQHTLTLADTLDITAQVLEALVAAHAAGIVHRDIKPENILIDEHGTAKVADFGLARAIGASNSSASSTLLGTVAYISPEVVTRGHSDERSDLYSLGVVLFEMLTGRQPFRGEQPVHVAFQHVHEDIPAPSTVVTGIPRELDSLVTWAAARKVEQRPATATDLLRAVRELHKTLPAAVLDSRPTTREDTDTSDVVRPTSHLDEVVAELSSDPRAFPPGLLAGHTPEDSAQEDAARPEQAASDSDAADPTGPGSAQRLPVGDETEGEDLAEAESTEVEETEREKHRDDNDQDSASRTVVVRAPRARRGRHLPASSRRRSAPMALLATLSLVAALGAGAWTGGDWYFNTGPGADRTIPVLAGTQLTDAESILDAADLSVRTEERFDDTVPAGHVISASPSAGAAVKKGDHVELVVSKGVQTFPVPEVEGTDVEEARAAVEDQGLELVEDDPEYSEEVPAGQVISQSQDADALPEGGEVHVVVSQGRQPITIPDQTGANGKTARTALESAGFTVTSSSAHSADVPSGNVISQSPASGTGHRGDTVALVTSLGPEMVKVPDVFQKPEADAKKTLEAAGFDVTVKHDRGEPVFGLVYEQSAEAGAELAKGSAITITVF
ncbi:MULTISPECIES: Stk1 family PASTA domain-containing Ser/Thr kinase [Brachybacterium]|uniref:Stk1 family PASTA domain-containing Ser/Thr kinase n=1 Tax=Brachybacterium TaxID=43668 RepID=UPI000BB71446|nr:MULTISPECIES: Stk1 family PASTA domain-containing Ser/Thr kinase [Brachybacterium]PCC34243.1 serine/threonine protein kinase [Brachybacterium alimentarium]RCS67130.1 serine/threonine protein kinase [Brachybacterium sp. JB7]RCS68252.1 serine/threonine protein kinase [Brachybacterium alimentarium]RCS77901.1 serine/threonine protein kinase [Brachybacterium alimentarium]RCS86861.1 serine/threonine protein kinase [Brachybacterium alimentarium]